MISKSLHKTNNEVVLGKLIINPPYEVNFETLHEEARIVYVLKGKSKLTTPTNTIYLTKGDLVIISSGNIVNNWIESEEFDHIEVIIFRLFPGLVEKIYKDNLSNIINEKSTENHTLLPAYKITSNKTIGKFIESIQHYFKNPEILKEELILIKIKELLFLLMTLKEQNIIRFILTNLFNPIEHKFSETIDANLFENLSINELAHLCNLSLSSFNRRFKKVYKQSPKKYILTKRLEKAKSLLSRPELRISDIALDCCFDDPANFSKSFSSYFGVSPSEYRKSVMA